MLISLYHKWCSPSNFSWSDVWFNLALKRSECGLFIFIICLKYHIHILHGYIFLKSPIWHQVCSPEKFLTNWGMQLLAAPFIVVNLGWFYSKLYYCIWDGFISVSYLGSFLGYKYCSTYTRCTQIHSKIRLNMR